MPIVLFDVPVVGEVQEEGIILLRDQIKQLASNFCNCVHNISTSNPYLKEVPNFTTVVTPASEAVQVM